MPKKSTKVERVCEQCGVTFPDYAWRGRRFCGNPCYFAHKQANRPSLTERFWQYVEPRDGCWEWKAGRNRQGYGMITPGNDHKRHGLLAHRVSWEIHNGPIPDGMLVCHICDNPPCCNPDHLFLGTHADNLADMRRKGREFVPRRLTIEIVSAIKRRIESGETQCLIAADYGISRGTVYDIANGRTWAWVE